MKLKLLMSLVVCVSLFSQPVVAAEESGFTDVSEMHPNIDAVLYLQTYGIVQGYEDGTFRPDISINRAEFLKIAVEAFEDPEVVQKCAEMPNISFKDTQNTAWYARHICAAMSHGAGSPVQGHPDGTFKPAQNISFVEAAKIIYSYLRVRSQEIDGDTAWFDINTQYKDWFAVPVSYFERGSAIPDSIQSLSHTITRGEMAEMIYRLQQGVTDKPTQTLESLMPGTGDMSIAEEKGMIRSFYEKLAFGDTMSTAYEMMETGKMSYAEFQNLYNETLFAAVYGLEFNPQTKEYTYQVVLSRADGEKKLESIRATITKEGHLSFLSQRELPSAVLQRLSYMQYVATVEFDEGDMLLRLCEGNQCETIHVIEEGLDTSIAEFGHLEFSDGGRHLIFDVVHAEGAMTTVVNTDTLEVVHRSVIPENEKGFTEDNAYYYACSAVGLYEGHFAVYDGSTFEEVLWEGNVTDCGDYSPLKDAFTFTGDVEGELMDRTYYFYTGEFEQMSSF